MKEDNNQPDLEFIAEGTKNIQVPEGKSAEFCPHLSYCLKQSVDKNCFYNKFLHCKTARELEKEHPLSKEDAHFLKYKNVEVG